MGWVADVVVVGSLLTRSATTIVRCEAAVVESPLGIRGRGWEEEAARVEVPALCERTASVLRSVRTHGVA